MHWEHALNAAGSCKLDSCWHAEAAGLAGKHCNHLQMHVALPCTMILADAVMMLLVVSLHNTISRMSCLYGLSRAGDDLPHCAVPCVVAETLQRENPSAPHTGQCCKTSFSDSTSAPAALLRVLKATSTAGSLLQKEAPTVPAWTNLASV